jgi:hypothetical protein
MYISVVFCSKCGKDTHHHNNKCDGCADRELRAEEARWASLTDREQVQELLVRIKKLERDKIRY